MLGPNNFWNNTKVDEAVNEQQKIAAKRSKAKGPKKKTLDRKHAKAVKIVRSLRKEYSPLIKPSFE